MPSDQVTAHFFSAEWNEDEPPEIWLDENERRRAGRFVFAEDARRWAVFRAKSRRALSIHGGQRNSEWHVGPGGKPGVAIPGLDFNLSHTSRLAVLLVSRAGPVGVDLEPLDRADELLDCAESFCHPDELASLPSNPRARSLDLLGLWTAKEALLKAVGTGLGFPPTQLRIEAGRGIGGPPGCERFHLLRLIPPAHSDHLLAAAVPSGINAISTS